MQEFLFVLAPLVFFLFALGFAIACDRLGGPQP